MKKSHSDANLVLVSDLHLGESKAPEHAVAFAEWLDNLRENRRGGRSWRLLLNGDTFEFLHLASFGNHKFWLKPPGTAIACRKLERIAEIARPSIDAMARFLMEGNELHFIVGNHDRELLLRSVRRMLRRVLARAAGVTFRERRKFFKRIVVHPWFYLEPGVLYVEHGNQFDEFSSYTEVLAPNMRGKKDELEEPVSHLAARHFLNRSPTEIFDLDNVDYWGFLEYIRWGLTKGMGVVFKLLMLYFATIYHLVVQAWERVPFSPSPSPRVMRAMRGVKARYGVPVARLRALRRLWRPPARVWSVMRGFLIDRFLLVVGALLLLAISIVVFGLSWWNLFLIPAILITTVATWLVLSRFRDLDVSKRMLGVAERVRTIAEVRYVAFGHSHVSSIKPLLEEGTWYLNPGGWPNGSKTPGYFVLERCPNGTVVLASVHA